MKHIYMTDICQKTLAKKKGRPVQAPVSRDVDDEVSSVKSVDYLASLSDGRGGATSIFFSGIVVTAGITGTLLVSFVSSRA